MKAIHQRTEVLELSDIDLIDELTRPNQDYRQMVIEEALRRILKKLIMHNKKIRR